MVESLLTFDFMYPQNKKKEYPSYILKDTWDEPPINPLRPKFKGISNKWVDEEPPTNEIDKPNVELNNELILKYLFEYVSTYFNQFGHRVPKGGKFEGWWHHHKYGTSYQPIVQMCYILKGQELRFIVRDDHSQSNITKLAWEVHKIKYDRETKMESYKKIDVCWGENESSFNSDNLTLALEYEDSGDVVSKLFEEIYKLIHNNIKSKFNIFGSRLNSELEIDYIKKDIENKLKKGNIKKFFDNRVLSFIFIAPDSLSNPTKICFSEYVYQNDGLIRVDNNKYFINVVSPDGVIIQKSK